jgi:hypothetical protein
MKRLWLIVLAVLAPFAALVFFGLRALDDTAPKVATPAVAPIAPAPVAAVVPAPPPAPSAPPTPAPIPAPAPVATAVPAPPPVAAHPSNAPLHAEPSPLDVQTAELANRGKMLAGTNKDLVLPPSARNRSALKPSETWNKNGFPPKAAAGAQQSAAHCWADNKARLGANPTAQVIVLAQPTADGKFEQATVRWSSWNDPIFMACVEDALETGSFAPGDPVPPAQVLHTLEFGAAP